MDERTAFERRLAASLEAYAGRRRSIDPVAIARAAASPLPRRRSIVRRFLPGPVPRSARPLAEMSSLTAFAIAAAAVLVVAVVGTNLSPAGREAAGASTSASPSPSATAPSVTEFGFPPEGAPPSTPERGELVVRLEGTVTGPLNMLWVYADGRMIWHRFGEVAEEASERSIGLYEQHLTPEGIEFLRSEIIATGLFESDLALARLGDAPFLEIEVRNGDRLVRATWAVRENWKIGPTAPTATEEEARKLRALSTLLTDPSSWPASAWEDRATQGYVPSRYSVCFRHFPKEVEPTRIWGLLPPSAQDVIRAGDPTGQASVPATGSCSRMTTGDARALAQILDDAGIARQMTGIIWRRYVLRPEGSREEVWLSFEPVLPHGEATWLGPG